MWAYKKVHFNNRKFTLTLKVITLGYNGAWNTRIETVELFYTLYNEFATIYVTLDLDEKEFFINTMCNELALAIPDLDRNALPLLILVDNAYLSFQKQTQLLITTVPQYVDQNMPRIYELYQQCMKNYLVRNMQSVGTQIVIFYILFITLRLYPSNWLLYSERLLLKM